MLTKEECEKELENSRYLTATIINQDGFDEYSCDFEQTSIFVTFEQLINEHFKLVEKFKQLDKDYDKFYDKSLIQIAELKDENNSLSKQLVECQRFCKEKQEMIDELKKTLNENIYKIFSNPPLKFEELKPNMWVWDSKYKYYIKIRRVKNKNSFIGYYPNFEIDPITDEPCENLQGIFFFEENRFYRYEVKDDETD